MTIYNNVTFFMTYLLLHYSLYCVVCVLLLWHFPPINNVYLSYSWSIILVWPHQGVAFKERPVQHPLSHLWGHDFGTMWFSLWLFSIFVLLGLKNGVGMGCISNPCNTMNSKGPHSLENIEINSLSAFKLWLYWPSVSLLGPEGGSN